MDRFSRNRYDSAHYKALLRKNGVKVVRGMTENVLKGINNGGQITFGYKLNAERKFEPHETYAPILQEIFTMYADGHTIKYIVDYLDEKKIRSYRGGKINGTGVQRSY